jgi:hypothetical protein
MAAPSTNIDRKVVSAPGPVDPNFTQEMTINPANGGVNVSFAGGVAPDPVLGTVFNGVADLGVTAAAAALTALAAGPGGILVRSHPKNDPTSIIRVATNAAANIGTPLAPGESYTFEHVTDASNLKAILEAAVVGAANLCISQV